MAEQTTSERTAAPAAVGAAPDEVDDEALIAQVTDARKAGDPDRAGVGELLQRAATRNKAALDRLAR